VGTAPQGHSPAVESAAEPAAFTLDALDIERAVVALQGMLDDRKPEPGSAGRPVPVSTTSQTA
jgi:flavin-binding protein dodecin